MQFIICFRHSIDLERQNLNQRATYKNISHFHNQRLMKMNFIQMI